MLRKAARTGLATSSVGIVDKLPLNIWELDCPLCAPYNNRDVNVVNNVLVAELAVKVH